jgi:hypothetical protein
MCELVIKTAIGNGDLMKTKSFVYRGFEIIETSRDFNIYHLNDELLKIIPKDKTLNSQWSIEVTKGFIDKYLKENR